MMTQKHTAIVLLWSLAIASLVLDLTAGPSVQETAPYPNRAIQIVVPFAPGGESDTFARHIKRAIDTHKLLPHSVAIVNRGGAGGTVGSRFVVNAKPDGYTVLLLHDAILTAKHSPNNGVDYGPEAFEAVAATGSNEMLLVASTTLPNFDLKQLMEEAKKNPDTITFGMNIGAPTHFVALMLEKTAPGARFQLVQAGGGSKRLHQLLGGHLQLTAFSVSEYLRFQSPETPMRAVAVFASERHEALKDVPTALEMGYPVVGNNVQMWWMPKGTPRDRVEYFAKVLQEAMQKDEVTTALDEVYVKRIILTGDALQERIRQREKEIAQVEYRGAENLPQLSSWILGVLGILGLVLVWKYYVQGKAAGENPGYTFQGARLAVLFMLLITFVVTLSYLDTGIRGPTLALVIGIGLVIGDLRWSQLVTLVPLSIILSFGIHWLFTVPIGAMLP